MLLKNVFRPAFAGASASFKQFLTNKKYDGATFDSTQKNDFDSFSSKKPGGGYRPSYRPGRKTVTLEIPGRTVAIAAGVLATFILLIVLAIVLLFSGDGNILYENNAFAAYQDTNGNYRVVMNGKTMSTEFENEVVLTEAKDNSFAYVSSVVDGATNVYVLDNGKLKLLCESVDKVLAYSDYEPGVVYKYGDKVEYSFDEHPVTLSKKNSPLPENFVISPDGKAVAYTIKNSASVKELYVYTENMTEGKIRSNGDKTTVPVSISNKGEKVVAYTEAEDVKKLYLVIENKDEETEYHEIKNVSGNFDSLIAVNADATEIVFTTKQDKEYRTYLYNSTKLKKGVTEAYFVSSGYAVPQIIDQKISVPESFKMSYFMDLSNSLTVYVNKKYESFQIYNYLGEIDPEENYLYAIAKHSANQLVEVDLPGEKANNSKSSQSGIVSGVVDFAITQKGNLYYVDEYGDLYFYNMAKEKRKIIASDVVAITFYTYTNDLYFEIDDVEATEGNGVYVTSEGSEQEPFKLAKNHVESLTSFTNAYSKKSYTYYHDKESDKYVLFYTANGSSFKKVAECNKIITVHEDPLDELVDDFRS